MLKDRTQSRTVLISAAKMIDLLAHALLSLPERVSGSLTSLGTIIFLIIRVRSNIFGPRIFARNGYNTPRSPRSRYHTAFRNDVLNVGEEFRSQAMGVARPAPSRSIHRQAPNVWLHSSLLSLNLRTNRIVRITTTSNTTIPLLLGFSGYLR